MYVENVAYFRTLAILHSWHHETRAIRTELDGIDTKDLERVWERDLANVKTEKDSYASVLYLVPQYSNPMGTVLSEGVFNVDNFKCWFFRKIEESCQIGAQVQCVGDLRRRVQHAL